MVDLALRILYGVRTVHYTSNDLVNKPGNYLGDALRPYIMITNEESNVSIDLYFYNRVLIAFRRNYIVSYDNGDIRTHMISEVGPTNSDILPNITTENIWETFELIVSIINHERKNINRNFKSLRLKTLKYIKEAGLVI